MKNIKMLVFLVVATVISVNAIDLEKLTEKDLAAMKEVEQSLYNIINNCDKADGNHQLRMKDLGKNACRLSVSQFNHILRSQFDQDVNFESEEFFDFGYNVRIIQLCGQYSKNSYSCEDCLDIAASVVQWNSIFSKAEKEGKGDMHIIDFRGYAHH